MKHTVKCPEAPCPDPAGTWEGVNSWNTQLFQPFIRKWFQKSSKTNKIYHTISKDIQGILASLLTTQTMDMLF